MSPLLEMYMCKYNGLGGEEGRVGRNWTVKLDLERIIEYQVHFMGYQPRYRYLYGEDSQMEDSSNSQGGLGREARIWLEHK